MAVLDQPIPFGVLPALPPPAFPAAAADIDMGRVIQTLQNIGLPALETDTYNREIIEDVIQRNLYQENIFNPPASFNIQFHQGDVKDPEKLQKELSEVLEIGLKQALVQPDPGHSARQAFGTLAEASHDMNNKGLLYDTGAINAGIVAAVNSTIGSQSVANLHYRELLPPEVITNKFNAAGQHLLQKPNLTVPEMNQISNKYKAIIAEVQVTMNAQGMPARDVSNILRQFSRWTDDHVENEQLRRILKNDARRVSGQRLSDLGFRASNLQPEIVPITVSKGIAIESPQARDELARIPNLVTEHVDNVGNTGQAASNLVGIIDTLNRNAFLHRMRFQKPAVQGVRPPPELININVRHPDNTIKSINQLKAELKVVTDNFINPRVTTLRHSSREAEVKGTSEIDFIRDLKAATQTIKHKSNKPRVRKSTMPRPHTIKKIGAIIIRGNTTNRKEIVIKASAKKEDLMKLVYLLTAEDGILEDPNHNHILKIKKGMGAAAVYDALMIEFSKNLGGDLILTYHSDSPVGGQFLDGFMSIFNDRPLIPIAPALLGGRLSLGALTSSGFMHSDPRQVFLNMPMHAFTPFRPAVLGRVDDSKQPIPKVPGSVSDISPDIFESKIQPTE